MSATSGSRSPDDSEMFSDSDDDGARDNSFRYSRDRSESRSTSVTKPSRKRGRNDDDDKSDDDDDHHEAKKARFNALEEEDVKWKLSKHDLKYVNDRMRINIPPKKVKELILKDMPVPSNLGKILQMDEF